MKKNRIQNNKIVKKFIGDSLYKNSIYLMLSSAISACLGFISWLIIARLFSAEDVGLATTMISAMGLIASLSMLGFNVGLVRFLPNSKKKNEKTNTAFTIVALTTIIVSSIFLLGLKTFSPELVFIKENLIMGIIFILFMIIYSLNSLIESIFIAFRNTKYILLKNSVFSVLKIVFPFLFIALGAFGIFSSYGSALFISVGIMFFVLARKFNYKPKFAFYDNVIKETGKYSFENYIAGFIGSASLFVLPLIITNIINPTTTAYYFMAMQIASLLYVIPTATTDSLFAEGSKNEKSLKTQVKKSLLIMSALLIPAIIIIVFFGNYILLAFGKEYSAQGFNFLKIMALSGIFVGIKFVFNSIFKVKKKILSIIIVEIIGVIIILGGSLMFIKMGLGLMGVGYAWIIGQAIISLIYGLFSLSKQNKK